MSAPRFKIVSRRMPHTGKRRWHLKVIVPHGASTLTTRHTHAEAIEALNTLTR
jgi:hypothetical protein